MRNFRNGKSHSFQYQILYIRATHNLVSLSDVRGEIFRWAYLLRRFAGGGVNSPITPGIPLAGVFFHYSLLNLAETMCGHRKCDFVGFDFGARRTPQKLSCATPSVLHCQWVLNSYKFAYMNMPLLSESFFYGICPLSPSINGAFIICLHRRELRIRFEA